MNNVGVLFQNLALTETNDVERDKLLNWSVDLFEQAVAQGYDGAYRNLGYSYLYLSEDEKALHAWLMHGNMHEELLKRAQIAEIENEDADALLFYRQVTKLVPEWSDGWYGLASLYKGQSEWEQAVFAYHQTIQRAEPNSCVISDSYFHLGKIYQLSAENEDLDLAIMMFESALSNDLFCVTNLKADTYYSLGEVYGWQGYSNQDVISQFEEALRVNPNHQWARLRFSYAVFDEDNDWETAVKNINSVIASWEKSNSPNLKWGYRFLGDVYFKVELTAEALDAYQTALSLDKTDTYVAEQINKIILCN